MHPYLISESISQVCKFEVYVEEAASADHSQLEITRNGRTPCTKTIMGFMAWSVRLLNAPSPGKCPRPGVKL